MILVDFLPATVCMIAIVQQLQQSTTLTVLSLRHTSLQILDALPLPSLAVLASPSQDQQAAQSPEHTPSSQQSWSPALLGEGWPTRNPQLEKAGKTNIRTGAS